MNQSRPARLNSQRLLARCITVLLLPLVSPVVLHAQMITFDAPGAGTGPFQGTFVTTINTRGMVGGFYSDSNYLKHGFVRGATGKFVSFEVPGATDGRGTYVMGINDQGDAVGFWNDANDAFHGFVRKADGSIVSYTDPDECTGGDFEGCQGTGFYSINDFGVISGAYLDKNYVSHGLVVSSGGQLTGYEAPGAGSTPNSTPTNYTFQGTLTDFAGQVNALGSIAANYIDNAYVSHGYIRTATGRFVEFDARGADITDAGYGTFPQSVNDLEAVTGYYVDASGIAHGFLRSASGKFWSFDASDLTAGVQTTPSSINDFGVVSGTFLDGNGVFHGFARDTAGKIVTFDAPNADQTPQNYNGTFASGVNLFGTIGGYYVDANFVSHGFLRTP